MKGQGAQVISSARARMQPYTPPPSGLLSGAAAAHARACGPPPSRTPASTSPALAMRRWPGVAPSSEPPVGRWGWGVGVRVGGERGGEGGSRAS